MICGECVNVYGICWGCVIEWVCNWNLIVVFKLIVLGDECIDCDYFCWSWIVFCEFIIGCWSWICCEVMLVESCCLFVCLLNYYFNGVVWGKGVVGVSRGLL